MLPVTDVQSDGLVTAVGAWTEQEESPNPRPPIKASTQEASEFEEIAAFHASQGTQTSTGLHHIQGPLCETTLAMAMSRIALAASVGRYRRCAMPEEVWKVKCATSRRAWMRFWVSSTACSLWKVDHHALSGTTTRDVR